MAVLQVTTAHYPESDGKPMGETDEHRKAMVRHIELLQRYYEGQDVYVSGDLLVYYEQGDPKKFVVPDAFVVKGLSPEDRRTFKLWIERKSPDVVIETTSRKTRRKDFMVKPALYARIGVKEYFLFDPDSEYLDPPLQGYRSVARDFERMVPDEHGGLVSHELGLRLHAERGRVQFFRLDTGERLLTDSEARVLEAEARAAAEARVAFEVAARQAAEAEVARLREELARRATPT